MLVLIAILAQSHKPQIEFSLKAYIISIYRMAYRNRMCECLFIWMCWGPNSEDRDQIQVGRILQIEQLEPCKRKSFF